MVPSLFQEATCSDLVFSRALSFFEKSIGNRLCFQRYWVTLPPVAVIHSTNGPFSIIKEQLQPHILSKLLCFFRTGGVVARRYHGYQRWYSSASGMYKLKDSLLSDSYPFLLWYCRYFKGAPDVIHSVKGTVFMSQKLSQPPIIVSSLWLIEENLKGTVFFWGKQL